MGYYSDVSLVLKKDDFPRLQALSSVCKSDYVTYADDVKTFTRRDGKDWVQLIWDAVKWYPEFDEVKVIQDFIAGVPHELIVRGEDGDLEHENTTALPDMFWS